jgi:hypothetical protein
MVTRLPGINLIGKDVSDCGHLPDVVLACGRRRVGGVEPFGDLPTTELFFYQGAIDGAHDVSLCGLDHHLRGAAMPFRQIPVPLTLIRPRHELPTSGFLQPAPPGPFGNLGTLILGDHALHWRQQFALRTIAERIVEKEHLRVYFGALFDQEPLMRIVPGEPIGRHDHNGIELPTPRRITQSVQGRAIQPRSADAIIALCMLGQQSPILLVNVVCEHASLILDRAFVLLLIGRDAGSVIQVMLQPCSGCNGR